MIRQQQAQRFTAPIDAPHQTEAAIPATLYRKCKSNPKSMYPGDQGSDSFYFVFSSDERNKRVVRPIVCADSVVCACSNLKDDLDFLLHRIAHRWLGLCSWLWFLCERPNGCLIFKIEPKKPTAFSRLRRFNHLASGPKKTPQQSHSSQQWSLDNNAPQGSGSSASS